MIRPNSYNILSPQNKCSMSSKQQQDAAVPPLVCEGTFLGQRGPCLLSLCPSCGTAESKNQPNENQPTKPSKTTKHEKDRRTVFSIPARWERCHTLNPALHRSQQCCASRGSTEHVSLRSMQPQHRPGDRNEPIMP